MSVWRDPAMSDRLCELWAEGLVAVEIGRRLGVSKNSVIGRANRIGLSRPSPIKSGGNPARPRAERGKPAASKRVRLPPLKSIEAAPAPIAAPAPAPIVVKKSVGVIGECAWPKDQTGHGKWRFCDAPTEPGKPYCTAHCDLAYARSPAAKRAVLATFNFRALPHSPI